jgi:hypothetical protein
MAVLSGSSFRSKHSATMDALEITKGKFVPSLGILGITLVDAQVPFRVFAQSMLSDKLILKFGRRPIFGPSAFSVCDNMSVLDELRGEQGCLLI